MLFVIAISALGASLGALEVCSYVTADCSGAGVCEAGSVDNITKGAGVCEKDGTTGIKRDCVGTTVTLQFYSATDCSTDASATCNLTVLQTEGATGAELTDCTILYKLGECKTIIDLGVGFSTMFKGSCPAAAADDDPCFSREAEACRVLDTSVAPSVAFRACFDEPAPMWWPSGSR